VSVPRYERKIEEASDRPPIARDALISRADLDACLDRSSLSEGGKDLVRGLVRLGRPAIFGGGGVGIEYGSLLKTAVDPTYLRRHVVEVAGHLAAEKVDILIVPGMSGYPIGAMYAAVAGLPAVLLKKQRVDQVTEAEYPVGTFVIPSYTGDGDVVMSADLVAVQEMVDRVLVAQLDAHRDDRDITLRLRLAGADDIIDKATMSQAVSESGLLASTAAAEAFVAGWRARSGDIRPVRIDVRVVSWVTPLIKGYNRPHAHLERLFGITPFAGLNIDHLQIDPPGIGIEGVGVIAFD
jgi:hypothetical protein